MVRGRKRLVCVSVPKECASVIRNRNVVLSDVYSTEDSLYLYSLGEYICLLLIGYLKISLIYM